jgi:hypothetical protein
MTSWRESLKYDPIPALNRLENEAIEYFVQRDLLEKKVDSIEYIWDLPTVQKILEKQQPNGSWRYPGKKAELYPKHHYSLVETWKQFRILVEQYELTKQHTACRKTAEFLFSCQTREGDIRGMIGNQYATYYTGAIMAVLIKAGYHDDPRIEKGFEWLLSMRQNDGGWTIPLLTHKLDRKTTHRLTSEYAEPVQPIRTKPFSHNWTDMVLRAFAEHPKYRKSKEARRAGNLLKSRFFQKDAYPSYQSETFWVRFMFWWPNLLTSLESLSLLDFSKDDLDIQRGLGWFKRNQQEDGLWKITYIPGKKIVDNAKTQEKKGWITLRVCRLFQRFQREYKDEI